MKWSKVAAFIKKFLPTAVTVAVPGSKGIAIAILLKEMFSKKKVVNKDDVNYMP